MNGVEMIELVGTIGEVWPSMQLTKHTPKAWQPILGDATLADALDAVQHLARTRTGYISPADIRRQIADSAGLLPPIESEAFAAVVSVAARGGVGASLLHPAVQAAYRAMGGPTGFDAPPAILRPQWGRAYTAAVAAHERELLAGDLGAAVAAHRRLALTAAERPAVDAEIVDSTVKDRSADVAALIATRRFALPAGDRAKLLTRRVGWERESAAYRRTRDAEPNPHYDPTRAAAAAQEPEAS